MSKRLTHKPWCFTKTVFAALCLVLIVPKPVFAACVAPASPEGGLNYVDAATGYTYCDGTNWQPMGGTASALPLSGITAAVGANTINSAAFAQVWNWNSLTTETALTLGSTSQTTGTIFNLTGSNNNVVSTGTVASFNVTGASNAAVPLMLTNAGTGLSFRVNDDGTATDASPFVVNAAGNVGIGTTTPLAPLHIAVPGSPAADALAFGDAAGVAFKFQVKPDWQSEFYLIGPYDKNLMSFNNVGTDQAYIALDAGGTPNVNPIDQMIFLEAADNVSIGHDDPTSTTPAQISFFDFDGGTPLASINSYWDPSPSGTLELNAGNNGTMNTNQLVLKANGAVGIGTNTPASVFVVAPPASEVIAAAGTITANACGTIKQITSTGSVTTGTTNTFTAPTASYAGCCMDVLNVDTADTITLDDNTNFKTAGAANIALAPYDSVRVCSDGTYWYQLEDKVTAGGAGALALNDLTDAYTDYSTDDNMFIGTGAGAVIASGGQGNMAIGENAGNALTTGDRNIFIGQDAGSAMTTGGFNTVIGWQAQGGSNYDSVTTIGMQSYSYPYGTAVGVYAGAAPDGVSIGSSAGFNNDASGDTNVNIGSHAGFSTTSGDYNTALGGYALYSNAANSESTAVGYHSMYYANSTATGAITYNTALGAYALRGSTTAANNTGTSNTAIGHSALFSNTSGIRGTAVGNDAMYSNTTGSGTAIGYTALYANTTGSDSVAIGGYALANNSDAHGNTAIGSASMELGASGLYSVAIGYRALRSVTGDNNIGIGYQAGDNITSGASNIIIGYDIDAVSATGSSQLDIGGTIYGDMANDRIRIGGSGAVGAGPFIANPPAAEVIAAAATITANACGTVKRISATANRTTNTTNTFTAPTASYAGCCMDVVNVDTADTITLDDNANFLTGGGANIALAPYDSVRVCSDGTYWYHVEDKVAGAAAASLSSLTAATATNTIDSTLYAQVWNWSTLSTQTAMQWNANALTSGKMLDLASSATAMTGTMAHVTLSGNNAANTGTLIKSTVSGASSAAVPIMVTNLGTGLTARFNDETGDADATPVVITAAGNVGIGTATPSNHLHIYDPDDSAVLTLESGEISASDISAIQLQSRTNGVNGDYYGYISMGGTGTDGAEIRTLLYQAGAGGNETNLTFATDGESDNLQERMRITHDGRVGIGTTSPAGVFVVAPPATETIAAAATITANSCGTIKKIQSTGSVTTGTTNTFTAPTASYAGCCMDVLNVDTADTITLDDNTNFKTAGGANIALAPYDSVRICSDGTYWYQVEDKVSAGGAIAINDLTDAATDYATDFNLFMGSNAGAGVAVGAQYNLAIGQNALDAALTNAADSNTALGYNALTANTSGGTNTALGYNTLAANVGGGSNVAVGSNALDSDAGGNANTALGHNAMTTSNGSSNNVSIGAESMRDNVDGASNVAIGYGGMLYAGSSDNSVAIGRLALGNASLSGNNNIAIGYQAGDALTSGSSNIIIGYDIDAMSATGSSQLNIGDSIYGDLANDRIRIGGSGTVTTGPLIANPPASEAIAAAATITANACGTIKQITSTGNVTTGTTNTFTAPTAAYAGCCMDVVNVDTADTITLDDNANFLTGGGANIALAPNDSIRVCSNGTYWYHVEDKVAGAGGGTIDGLSDAKATYTATGNMFLGHEATGLTTGNSNVSVGPAAMDSIVDGQFNTAVGLDALTSCTGCTGNTGIGEWALRSLTSASGNTGIGSGALYNTVNGSSNVGVGENTLANTDSNGNVAVGYYALSTTSGSNNIALGFQAGDALSSGSYNIIIGDNIDAPSATGSSQLNIGDSIYGDLSNDRIRVGGSGSVTTGPFIVSAPATETIAAAATITANACGTIKQIQSTGSVTTGTTNTFTAPTASYAGCCMDVVNVDTADTITLDDNANFLTGGGANIALAPNDSIRVCSNGTYWYHVEDKVASAASLSSLTAATATNTINSGTFAQEWQWNTLAGNTALRLSSTSTAAASNAQKMLEILLSGANGTAAQTTYGGYITNTHTGTTSTNVGLFLGASGGATANYAIQLDGDTAAQTIAMARETTAATAGRDLTIQAGGAVSGGTNLNGGSLVHVAGTSTGSGYSFNSFYATGGGSTGTTDRAPVEYARMGYGGLYLNRFDSSWGGAVMFNAYVAGGDTYWSSDSAFEVFHDTASDVLRISAAPVGTASNSVSFVDGITVASDSTVNLASAVRMGNDITSASLGANQNDYSPTGLSTASVIRLTASTPVSITGLAGGADGRIITLMNVGSNAITLSDDSASSTAANRFALTAALVLAQDQGTSLIYDSTSSRWRVYGGDGTGSAGSIAIDNLTDAATDYSTDFNLFMGSNAGAGVVVGAQYNLAIGQNALDAALTNAADGNTAVGYTTLSANTSGFGNTAFGSYALATSTTGNENVALGGQALYLNTTGASNTAVGSYALQSNTTAGGNVGVGFDALYTNVTGSESTAVGYQAMRYANSTSSAFTSYNTAVGFQALRGSTTAANNTGIYNTAVGHSALLSNTSGLNNTAIGSVSLDANTTGNYNTALGDQALTSNTTGGSNTALGIASLRDITGDNNTAIGSWALLTLDTGNQNTVIGSNAMNSITTGNANIAIGNSAADNITTGSNNITIGSNIDVASATGSNQLNIGDSIYGDMANDRIRIGGSGAVGAGPFVAAPPAAEAIAAAGTITANACGTIKQITSTGNVTTGTTNTFTAPTASYAGCCMDIVNVDTADTITLDDNANFLTGGGANIALPPNDSIRVCSNGTYWYHVEDKVAGAGGAIAINDLTDAAADYVTDNNLFMGSGAGAGVAVGAQGNTVVGQGALAGTLTNNADWNTVFGNGTMAINTTGQWNTAMGYNTMYNNTTGSANAAFGLEAAQFMESGSSNVAVGPRALRGAGAWSGNYSGNTGSNNVAIGEDALAGVSSGGQNIGIGFGAGGTVSTGTGNISIGGSTNTSTTGNDNIALGQSSMNASTVGNQNIALGILTLAGNVSGNGNVAIGSFAMRYANDDAGFASWQTTYNTAVGTEALMGSATPSANTGTSNTAIGHTAMTAVTSGSNNVALGDRAADNLTTGSNNITIGSDIDVVSATTSNQLNIGNTIYGNLSSDFVGIGNNAPSVALDVTGDIEYTGTITDVSDIRLKTDIHSLMDRTDLLAKIDMINTYSFRMKDDKTKRIEFGVMAQELEKVFPELVNTANDTIGTKSVNYVGLIAPMIEATKDLRAQNKALKAELAAMKASNNKVQASLEKINAQVDLLNKSALGSVNKAGFIPGFGALALFGLGAGAGAGIMAVRRRRG